MFEPCSPRLQASLSLPQRRTLRISFVFYLRSKATSLSYVSCQECDKIHRMNFKPYPIQMDPEVLSVLRGYPSRLRLLMSHFMSLPDATRPRCVAPLQIAVAGKKGCDSNRRSSWKAGRTVSTLFWLNFTGFFRFSSKKKLNSKNQKLLKILSKQKHRTRRRDESSLLEMIFGAKPCGGKFQMT